eukprot:17557-Heterococcus_DN1.PRE.2
MARISESAPIMSDDERSIATIGDEKDEAKEPEGAMNVLTLYENQLFHATSTALCGSRRVTLRAASLTCRFRQGLGAARAADSSCTALWLLDTASACAQHAQLAVGAQCEQLRVHSPH